MSTKKLSPKNQALCNYLIENYAIGKRHVMEKATGLEWPLIKKRVWWFRSLGFPIPVRRNTAQPRPQKKEVIDYLVANYATKTRDQLMRDLKMTWPQIISAVTSLRKSGITIPSRDSQNNNHARTVENAARYTRWETLLSYNRPMLVKIIQHLRGLFNEKQYPPSPLREDAFHAGEEALYSYNRQTLVRIIDFMRAKKHG